MPFGMIASIFNTVFGNAIQNKRQKEALKAQQQENEKDRKFNAEQAELNRTWQEKMYNSYESPIAQAQQRQQAGLNPAEGVSSQSVGSGSTASAGSSSLPTPSTPVTLDSGAFNGLLNVVEQFKQQRIATKQADENLKATILENQKRAIDAQNYPEVVRLQMDLMRQDKHYKYWSAEKLKAEAERQIADNEMFKDFKDSGGNTYQDESNFVQAQTEFEKAQKEYQELMGKIAQETSDAQKKVYDAQAQSLKANAVQAYANAILSSAQTEVAKSTKIQIDANTKIAQDKAAQDAAMHELLLIEQKLINAGISADNYAKELNNLRNRILNGDIKTFGELGQFLYTHLQSLIPFASSQINFGVSK